MRSQEPLQLPLTESGGAVRIHRAPRYCHAAFHPPRSSSLI